MYRNCVYDSKKGECVLFKWDEMGKRVKESFSYFPYYYVETFNDAKSDAISIFGTKLKKRVFKNQYERNESVKGFISNRVFYNLQCEHQFLIDHFNNTPEFRDFDEFSKNPLKIFFWDIEVYTPAGCGFPEPKDANFPIDLMTIYDSIEKKYFVWGLKPYETDRDDVVFVHCKTEKDLLRKFVKFWISDYPDVLTAWNLDFDLNYTINRLRKLFGKDSHEILSPVEKIYEKTKINKFKQPVETYVIKGISQLDYIDVYKKFNPTQKPSYKLDDIAEEELGENKVDFDGSLAELSDNDWNTYVEYNIKDVELVKKLDDNLEYMAIIKQLAYMGLCGIEDALGTIKNVDGVIAIEALKHGKIIPTFVSGGGSRFEGAYVKDPVRGLSEYVVSYDLNSLYPSILITLNASPETKVGEILSRSDGVVTISFVNGKNYELPEEKFQQFVKSKNIAISSANILFDQNNKGLIPDIVDRIYQDRVQIRKRMKTEKLKMLDLDKRTKEYKELSVLCKQLNIRQLQYKIFINSCYGYLGNGFAAMFDQDIARSVTLTGQECIKNSDKIIQAFKFEGADTRVKSLYCDTDSLYISFKPLVDEGVLKFWEEEGKTISKEFYDICDNIIENYLNDGIKKWGETALNSKDCRFQFKRESICDAGLWLQKKRYILNVMDMEGVPTDNKIKVTGYDTQSSAVPKIVKPYLFEMLRTIFSDKTKSGCNIKYKDIYDRFKALNYVDVAFPKSLNDLKKYEENCNGFQTVKGMPCHVKSAYFHNLLIDELKLENKYKKFVNGDKVRYIYVCKNKYGIEAIAFKDKYPTEFEEIFEVDWEKMFEKIVEKSIERLYNAMDWELDKSMLNSACDLMSLLG